MTSPISLNWLVDTYVSGDYLYIVQKDDTAEEYYLRKFNDADGSFVELQSFPYTDEDLSYPIDFMETTSNIYFFANHPDHGIELWKSNKANNSTSVFYESDKAEKSKIDYFKDIDLIARVGAVLKDGYIYFWLNSETDGTSVFRIQAE